MNRRTVLVTGGRAYSDREKVAANLARLAPRVLIHGGASGADSLADTWARENGVHVFRCDALWAFHGRSAGPIRNGVMIEVAGRLDVVVLAFPGGRGTANCVSAAREAGLPVEEAF